VGEIATVFIVGGSGFVGSNLSNFFLQGWVTKLPYLVCPGDMMGFRQGQGT